MSQRLQSYQMLIGDSWCEAASGETIEAINPATAEAWARVPRGGAADVDAAVQTAAQAFRTWRRTLPKVRGRLLRRLGELIAEHAHELAELETKQNGKVIRITEHQLEAIPEWYEFYGGLADKLNSEVITTDQANAFNFTLREPLGVVAAIVPWNSPLLIATYKIAPALATGNTIVIKPAEQTPVTALILGRLALEAGLPPGVLNVVTGYGEEAGQALVSHPGVAKIAFTGGTDTGVKVAAHSAQTLKRLTLELGGKSPQIIFADADLAAAAPKVISGIFSTAVGQTCRAGSLLLLHRSIDGFVEELVERASKLRIGDPMDERTDLGPLAFQAHRDSVARYVKSAVEEGGRVLCGGAPPPDLPEKFARGFFYQPTIIDNVTPSMRVYQEEIFGPVLSVCRFSTDDEAIALANQTKYGLACGLWTRDVQKALRLTSEVEAGTVWLNTYHRTSFASPFGGYKMSGYGRENGIEVMREYTQVKNVWMDLEEVEAQAV